MKTLNHIIIMIIALSLGSCMVIQPGQVGVKQKFGKLDDTVLDEGPHFYNPFGTRVLTVPVRTENIEIALNLPSKEGLNVGAEISILYRIEKAMVPELITDLGYGYPQVIRSVFRSASADVCSQFMAKDMHSGKRAEIEAEIADKMSETLNPRGIVIESVLMKTIKLPDGLYNSIVSRLEAEQDAMRMQFILEQEKLEADRKIIQAEGNRDAQIIMSEGLTEEILKLKSIEAFLELSKMQGAKIVISGGEIPLLVGE
jgi:prohibitin 1